MDATRSPDSSLATAEYEALRQELHQYRQYIFERPLLIVGAGVAFSTQEKVFAFVPALVAVLLAFNLWFTVNRLRSSARIIAYIQLVLEERWRPWTGWESSLRRYRKWKGRHWNRELERTIEQEVAEQPDQDALRYYGPILTLHAALGAGAGFAAWGGGATMWTTATPPGQLATAVALGVLAVMVWLWWPTTIKRTMELERRVWKRVLKAADDEPDEDD